MNDRELLELAAKAHGLALLSWQESGEQPGFLLLDDPRPWNPLDDDGDALRMAARLSIDIEWQNVGDFPEPFVEAYRRAGEGEPYFCALEEEGDVRRAIVRVAAEIGKNMP